MDSAQPGLRIGYVPGVQPDKWLHRWRERHRDTGIDARVHDDPRALLDGSDAAGADDDRAAHVPADNPPRQGIDVAFFRELADAPRSAPEGLFRIPLYTETMAVVAGKDHEVAAFDALDLSDLEGERWVTGPGEIGGPEDEPVVPGSGGPLDPLVATRADVSAAADLVATGTGLLVLPQPWARAMGRRDLVARPLDGVPATRMGVAWSGRREGDALIDAFVGIVRGRTARSSRG